MNRKAKQRGSGGRLRLGLLVATAAAFLLVPAAAANAAPNTFIEGAGEGSGWVKSVSGAEGGEPNLECHWNGELQEFDIVKYNGVIQPPGTPCETEALIIPPAAFAGASFEHTIDAGSEFSPGWEPIPSFAALSCPAEADPCAVSPTFAGGAVTLKATFSLKSEPLNLTVSGAPGGELECEINGGAKGSCPTEAPVGKEVKVFATGTGVELNEWTEFTTGTCEGTSDNPCTFTMPEEAVSANAEFVVTSETLSVTAAGGGTGTIVCEDTTASEPCSGTALYGHTISITAEPDAENVVEKIETTGSANGECSITGEGGPGEGGSCGFEITEATTVTVYFENAGTKDSAKVETVHGEVPQTTTLDGAGCEDVDLGEFIPGVDADYPETCVVVLTSTGAETTFTASDESAEDTGHLVHSSGAYALEEALEVKAEDSQGKGTGPGLTELSPVTLLTFEDPIAKDTTTLTFNQHIGEEEGLLTGVYSKTILLTLEQTP